MSDIRNLSIFNEPHVAEVILYVRLNPGCSKTEIYRDVARGDRMSAKIDLLSDRGILEVDLRNGRTSIVLTELGRGIADHLQRISEILI